MMTIAFWCVAVCLVLPYGWYTLVRKYAKNLSSNSPRDSHPSLQGVAKWALGAHQNALETNPMFVAAVLIASFLNAPQARLDMWAMAYVVCRVLHGLMYVSGKGALRSAAFGAGLICIVGIFVLVA